MNAIAADESVIHARSSFGPSSSSTLRLALRRAQLARDSVAEAAATTMLVHAYARGDTFDLSDSDSSICSLMLFERILQLPTPLFGRLEPYVDRLIDQLLEVSASLSALQYTAFWQIPLNRMVQHHAPVSEGDWIWRIYDALLRQATTPLDTGSASSSSSSAATSASSSSLRPFDRSYGRISLWWERMACGPPSPQWRHPYAADWTDEAVCTFLSLLQRYDITHDEHGIDFARGLILHGSPERVSWWLSVPSNRHSDWLWPSGDPEMNLLQFAIDHANELNDDDANRKRDLIQAEVDAWTHTHWLYIRHEFESHIIRDLASMVIDYLTPPLGVLAGQQANP
jgi:hypothetical protein